MATCSSCGAPIEWVLTKNRRAMPLDEAPVEDGNVRRTGLFDRAKPGGPLMELVEVETQQQLLDTGVERYVSHFVTCPNRDEHRKPKAPPRIDPNQVGGARARHDSPTSIEAAGTVKLGEQIAAVLADLAERPDGATAYELANDEHARIGRVRPGISANQIGARFGELRDLGLIVRKVDDDGAVVLRRAAVGRAQVHEITADGRVEARRLAGLGGDE